MFALRKIKIMGDSGAEQFEAEAFLASMNPQNRWLTAGWV